ncbi:MAG: ATPase [Pseudomonadota bacterium]
MAERSLMEVTLLTPAERVFEGPAVKLVARGLHGSFAILPNHADTVAPLATGVVALTLATGAEQFFGTDDGLLIKHAHRLRICVHRVVPGASLEEVASTVAARFGEIADRERLARTALARLEAIAMRRFVELREPDT